MSKKEEVIVNAHAAAIFCLFLITFVNSRLTQNVGPDLDPNCWHSESVPERFFLKKKKVSRRQKT